MPDHHVRRLEIWTVEFQHRHARQPRERAPGQPGGNGIDGKPAPEEPPHGQRRRQREPEARDQTRHALRHEPLGPIVAKEQAKHDGERDAPGYRQHPGATGRLLPGIASATHSTAPIQTSIPKTGKIRPISNPLIF